MARKILSLGFLSLLAFSPYFVLATGREECYNDIGKLQLIGSSIYLSLGLCLEKCQEKGYSVYAMQTEKCFCGHKLPPANAKLSLEECNVPCPGYPAHKCGGENTWTVVSDSDSTAHEQPKLRSPESKTVSASETIRTLNVNPTVIQTGIAAETSVPSSILTAPTTGPKNAEVAQALAVSSLSASPSSPTVSSSNAVVPTRPASLGSVVGAIFLPLVLLS
ncbi:WSC domain-containing protein [Aspergillus tanneri]|uniref:WSC domain-containing protein n=1 Tax=Aspergillus tanneri TaxID=1220188 RepID=A0A5M9MFK7_9EURO|nr:uncharacterized protein ATNIH1004_007150 [Aspergillus tanneri]KAA8645731.1 hypothetical protein ATNIH1004_007150 [Aspergillus tanneri]